MNASNYQMRRATLDDLVELRKLWQQAQWAVHDLEKRLTEFQVVETADGTLLGCIGLRIEGQQGKIHSEAYRSQELEGDLRWRLWERVQSVARNHGLYRVWTLDKISFWRSQGFTEVDEALLDKIPASFGDSKQTWLLLRLREEAAAGSSLEHEFELFKQSQNEMSERVLRQARALRILAGFVAVLGLVAVFCAVCYVLRRLPRAKL